MKLIRFGKEGQEKPGIHLDGKNYDLSAFVKDYDERPIQKEEQIKYNKKG